MSKVLLVLGGRWRLSGLAYVLVTNGNMTRVLSYRVQLPLDASSLRYY